MASPTKRATIRDEVPYYGLRRGHAEYLDPDRFYRCRCVGCKAFIATVRPTICKRCGMTNIFIQPEKRGNMVTFRCIDLPDDVNSLVSVATGHHGYHTASSTEAVRSD